MSKIRGLSPGLAHEIAEIVRRELRSSPPLLRKGVPVPEPGTAHYVVKVTTEVSAATDEILSGRTAGDGEGDVYRRNTSDNTLERIYTNAKLWNHSTKPFAVDTWQIAHRDPFGDLYVVNLATRSGIYKAPGGGIAARSGTTLGSATCTLQSVDGGTLSAESTTETIYNMDSANAVGADAYIHAKEDWEGNLIVDWEEC